MSAAALAVAPLWRFAATPLTAVSGRGGGWYPTAGEPGTNGTGVPRTAVEGAGPAGTAPAASLPERGVRCAPGTGVFAVGLCSRGSGGRSFFSRAPGHVAAVGTTPSPSKGPDACVAPVSPSIPHTGTGPTGKVPAARRSNVTGVGSARTWPSGGFFAGETKPAGAASSEAESISGSGVLERRTSAGEAPAASLEASSTAATSGSSWATAACCCWGDCCARASSPKKAKKPAASTIATSEASDLRLRGSPWLMVSIAPPRNKNLSLPIVLVVTRPPRGERPSTGSLAANASIYAG